MFGGSAAYGSVSNVLMEQGGSALKLAEEKWKEAAKYAEQGNWTWKIAGFSAGCSIATLAILSIPVHALSPFSLVIDIYLLCFGLLAIVLEYKEKLLTQKYLDLIRREALFLYRPYGRAAFYFFIGILVISQNSFFSLGFFVGAYTATIGAVVFVASRSALQHAAAMRSAQLDQSVIKEKFNKADKDHSGTLDSSELAVLCADMGTTLSRNELESALFALDKDGSGNITYDEFVAWYYGKEDIESMGF